MTALLEVNGLSVSQPAARSHEERVRRKGGRVKAVNEVSFELAAGENLGIVGESGAGKSTLARAILRLLGSEAGEIHFDGQSVKGLHGPALAAYRRQAQLIFSDPLAALNPRLSIAETLAEPLAVHRLCTSREAASRVDELMARVGLSPELRRRRPSELSAVDCQRVSIARALTVGPRLLIADDAVAGLDVPLRAQILNLLGALSAAMPASLIMMARDIGMLRRHCQRIAVMYLGRIVEIGPTEEILARPRHPYTQALVASTPRARADAPTPRVTLPGETPSPAYLPQGCVFHPRCAKVLPVCSTGSPPIRRSDGPMTVYCHLYAEPSAQRR